MTTTETTRCDGCGQTIEAGHCFEITILGLYTYEVDRAAKHLCGTCWPVALAAVRTETTGDDRG